MTPETFQRKLRNLESAWRRQDNGELTGRNRSPIPAATRELDAAITADAHTDDAPLCTFLDNNPKVAARWSRCERRNVGLPV